jgi:hypothetical protein
MKKIFFAASFTLIAAFAIAQPPAGNANIGDTYGESFTVNKTVDVATLPAQLSDGKTTTTVIKAKVIEVCAKKGCWAKVQVNDSTTAFVRMKDYGFFLPTAVKGKTIAINAEVKMDVTSVDDLKHYAKDAKKSQAEIDAITQPKQELKITASGITVVK